MSLVRCFHCDERVPPQVSATVEFDGEPRAMCCLGCHAVMSAIIEAGLDDYYRFRSEPAVAGELPAGLAEKLDALAIYDTPEVSDRYLHPADSVLVATHEIIGPADAPEIDAVGNALPAIAGNAARPVEIDLIVQDLRCGACVWLLERAVRQLPGVSLASFNFSTSRGHVEFDLSRLQLSSLLRRMASLGYQALPFDIDAREQQLQRESRTFSQRLFVAGIGMMQVMMYALPVYVMGDAGIDPSLEHLLRWASLVLTTPVLLYAAAPFLRGAWRDLRNLRPGMDVPVSIGLLLAFSLSVHATLTGQGEIYFDSVSMFVFLLLGTRYLEWRTRRRAMRTVDEVATSAPETAQLLSTQESRQEANRGAGDKTGNSADSGTELVPAARLEAGDVIRVDAGSRVPVDASVLQGSGSVDNALLTGESLPVTVRQGDFIAGGAMLVGSPMTLRVERPQAHSTFSTIQRLVERGGDEKPRAVQLADYVASIFVSLLLLLALAVFAFWWYVDADRALSVTISVLIVSCPCALSLATPAAMAAATGRLLQQKILVSRGHALDQLARVSDIVFDKTGTVTTGEPAVTSIATDSMAASAALALAQWMEDGSAHPYAKALLAHQGAAHFDEVMALFPELRLHERERIEHVVGSGIVVKLDGSRELRLGAAHWCGLPEQEGRASTDTSTEPGDSEILLVLRQPAQPPVRLAVFSVADPLRLESAPLMAVLRDRGFRLHLLSGDRSAAVQQIAATLGIPSFRSDASPRDKQAYVEELQAAGKTVLMIGDGVNDAPVLAHADVSLALSSASSLAQTAADVISLKPGLQAVLPLIEKARSCRRVMRQNIAWAIGYNLVAIPVAATGYLPAWGAAIGMALSSLLVALNALRLWHDRGDKVDRAGEGRVARWNRCIS